MPGGDRTGPWGAGPRTGRGMGFCAGYNVPGYANPGGGFGYGRGMGMGRGRGHGNRWRFYATGVPGWARGDWAYGYAGDIPPQNAPSAMNRHDELKYLKSQAEYLTESLNDITSRIEELEKSKTKSESK